MSNKRTIQNYKQKESSKASTLIRTTIYSTAIQLKEDIINQIYLTLYREKAEKIKYTEYIQSH